MMTQFVFKVETSSSFVTFSHLESSEVMAPLCPVNARMVDSRFVRNTICSTTQLKSALLVNFTPRIYAWTVSNSRHRRLKVMSLRQLALCENTSSKEMVSCNVQLFFILDGMPQPVQQPVALHTLAKMAHTEAVNPENCIN